MDDLKPCSRCGSTNITHTCVIGIDETRVMYFCRDCDAGGPYAPSQEEARAAWNEKQEAQGGLDSPKRGISTIAERSDDHD